MDKRIIYSTIFGVMNKLGCLITLVFLLNFVQANSQALNWVWAKSAGGPQFDHSRTIKTDRSGNVIIGGRFNSPTLVFDTITLTNSTLGSSDLYITKYNNNGNALWARSASGNQFDGINGVVTDSANNVYAAGYFRSATLTLDSVFLTNPNNYYHALLVKYDSTGNLHWVKSSSSNDNSFSNTVATDAWGNIYMAGCFDSDSITFGTTTLYNDSAGEYDIFIVKYDSSGNLLWLKGAGGEQQDVPNSITIDAFNNIYSVGSFASDTLVFGNDTLFNPYVNTANLFIVKYDSSGNLLWARAAGESSSNGMTVGNSVTTDNSGNLFVTGYFGGDSIWFDNIVLHNHVGPGPYNDMFIVKYDANGNAMWAHDAGGTDFDQGYSVTSDYSGDIYVSGHFQSPSITFGSFTIINNGNWQMFVVKYDNNGNALWTATALGGFGIPHSITTDATNNIYVTGDFQNPSITFGSIILNNVFYTDIFLAKLNSTTGISEEYSNEFFQSPYPNPFSSFLSIKGTNQNGEIILYDITSRKLLQQKFTNSISLNTEQFAKGIYLYEVRNKNGVIKKGKVVKE
ncbi:MAG: T9SS type A sorting domain-containing protein [Bacteroidia bacterium]